MKYSRHRLLNSYLNKQADWWWPPSWGEDDSPFSSGREYKGNNKGSDSKSPGGSPGGGGGNSGPSEPVPGGTYTAPSTSEEEPKKKKGKMNKLMKMMFMAQLMNGGGGGHAMPMFTPFGYASYGGGGGGGVNPMMLMMLANMSSKKSKPKQKLSPRERILAYVAARQPLPVATPVVTQPDTNNTSTTSNPAAMYSEEDLARKKEEIRRRVEADKAVEDNADRIINADIQRREVNRRKWKKYRLMKSPIYAATMLGGAHAGYNWLGNAVYGDPKNRKRAGDTAIGNFIWWDDGSKAAPTDSSKQSWGEFLGRSLLGLGGMYLGARAARLGTSYFEPEDLSTSPLPIQ